MKKISLLLFVLFVVQSMSIAQCGERYKSRYFNNIQIFRDVVYTKDAPTLLAASLTTETTYDKDLVMDIFMPPPTDTVTTRPVIVIAHGGGFINVAFMGGTVLVGTMDNDDVQALADTFAHWGYVTACIEYRLGFNVASQSSIKRAVWRGAQDMSAAARFFRKNAAWFGVNPNLVFVAGSSAGAFCAIHSTFVDYPERMPESFELIPILKKDLGAMHSRPIVELTSFNPFSGTSVLGNDVDSIPSGIGSYWGAIADLAWIPQGNNKAPMIMFHGTDDIIVDNKCAKPFSSVILVAPETCGSYMMDSTLAANNMPHEVHYGQGESHEYWGVLNGNWTTSGPNAYWPDIIQKTANFFYDIMKPAMPAVTGPDTVLSATNYTYSVVNPVTNFTYCWEITNGTIVSANSTASTIDVQFYTGTSQGMVQARAINQAEVASDGGQKNVVVTTSIGVDKILQPISSIQVQPNPSNGVFVLSVNAVKTLDTSIQMFNNLGQQIWSKEISIQEGVNQLSIEVDNLPKGVYVLTLKTAENSISKQVVLF